MKLSFCIPTFNRCNFLKKNIDIIIRQIRELSVENEVEILVNDNASPDMTEELCLDFIGNNPDIHIEYHKNERNEGPDWNFIKAMRLAHGEYSILFGDDDFLEEGALKTIINLIENKSYSIFLSNRICIDAEGKYIREQKFLDISESQRDFDFSNEDSIRSFFYGVDSLGGVLTFISSVVYKTNIIEKYPFTEKCIGTNYAFLYYWWKELLSGSKLYYLNKSLVRATTNGTTNNNYGRMVKRALVDYIGIPKIVETFTNDNDIKRYFNKAINCDHSFISIQDLYVKEKRNFENQLEPVLLNSGWTISNIHLIKYSVSLRRLISVFVNLYIRF